MATDQTPIFSNISINQWRQFQNIDIDLHPSLTILTGANGSGKSTLLSILEGNLIDGQHDQYLATPERDKKTRKTKFSFGGLWGWNTNKSENDDQKKIGKLELKNEQFKYAQTTSISLPPPSAIEYTLEFSRQPEVMGFKIGSHRASPKYQKIYDIPIDGTTPKNAFYLFRQSLKSYEHGSAMHMGSTTISNPVSPLKQMLISFALQGSSNEDTTAVPEIKGLFRDFQNTLRKLLPKEIQFQKLNVRSSEVIVETNTGDFPIDGASGGLMSLIQTAWQIFLYTKTVDGKCVVLMDEPENHLHPSLQRAFLSRLVEAFADVQFVVATHSPFIICSVKNSFVYALRHQPIKSNNNEWLDRAAIVSEKIDLDKSVGTASRVLDEVLGVSVTMPIWAEDELNAIVSRFQAEEIDETAMQNLRRDLADAGLSNFFPQAISKIVT